MAKLNTTARRPLRLFARNERGATAVEFALLAAPFFGLLLGIVELGLIFQASVALDNGVQTASRKIRTGQLVSSGTAAQKEISRQQFRDLVCAEMGFMESNCKTNLDVDVRTFTDFEDITYNSPITTVNGVKTWSPGSLQYETGASSQIVLVRAYYRWGLAFPGLNAGLVRLPGHTLLTSVTTFRNEPYSATSS